AAEKKLDLIPLIDPDFPPCIGSDVTRLRQVLVNLVSNAVKFTAEGEVVVRAALADRTLLPAGVGLGNDRQLLHFSVQDSGIGIPVDKQDRLFKSFSQVDSSTSRRFGGTGLGLAICKRIVELMGGAIWVESAPGRGSTFHFTIQSSTVPSENPESD